MLTPFWYHIFGMLYYLRRLPLNKNDIYPPHSGVRVFIGVGRVRVREREVPGRKRGFLMLQARKTDLRPGASWDGCFLGYAV